MLFDNHAHTTFSSDSDMQLADALKTMEVLGLGLVCTEHFDYDYIDSKFYTDMTFRFNPAEYWEKYLPYRSEKLRLGVEVGLTDTSHEANVDFIAQAPFDLVVGSVHFLDMLDLYYPDFYEGKTKKQAVEQYLVTMEQMVRENSYIDILGHIDYICRYMPYEDKHIGYQEFADHIDAVLRTVIETDTVMEINTRRLADRMALKELVPIYARYRELGGKYISLGSDAHNTESLGMNFAVVQDMVEALALQPVTFCERKMEYCK